MRIALRERVAAGPIYRNRTSLQSYLRFCLAHEKHEQMRVLFLNARYCLLADEILWHGTIDQVSAYPREIVRRVLELGAKGVVLVHNHPSGDPRPSENDISLTRMIVRACKPLDIRVHDHLIVAGAQVTSLKKLGIF
jgi:DNA repair protein RadC